MTEFRDPAQAADAPADAAVLSMPSDAEAPEASGAGISNRLSTLN